MTSVDDVIGWESKPRLILGNTFLYYPQYGDLIDITDSFKDPGFLAAVRDVIGKPDGPIYDHFVASIDVLYVSSWDTEHTISDLSGIEHFKSLRDLYCYNNSLTSLDLSQNLMLEYLGCGMNELTSLDLSNNTELYGLDCYSNQLTTLNVSKNTKLRYLYCNDNLLETLDFSNNTVLESLYCYNNVLTSLDVSKNSKIDYLNCGMNKLTTLDLSNKTALISLDCWDNRLTTLDLSNSPALESLYCNSNLLTKLDVLKNSKLTWLHCEYNNMRSIDDVIGWRENPELILEESFFFYPQNFIYDLNKDGLVDLLDLGIMLLYVGYNVNDPEWDTLIKVYAYNGDGITAKDCDTNMDDEIDMGDLINMMVNFGTLKRR